MPTSEGLVLPLLMCFWNSDRDVPIGMPLTDKSLHTEHSKKKKDTKNSKQDNECILKWILKGILHAN